MINVICSEHAQNWLTDTDPARYKSYDLQAAKASFVSFNAGYFKSMYFDLAPVLAVPLYRMQKPAEFLYRDVYSQNYTDGEAEVLANRFSPSVFAHERTRTQTILKASPAGRQGSTDSVSVTAYSFDTVDQVDYVSVYGGDGRYHSVPVPWVEYIPVERTSEMALKRVGGSHEEFERRRSDGALSDLIARFSACGSTFADGLMAFPLMKGAIDEDTDQKLSSLFGQEGAAAGAAVFAGIAAAEAAADLLDAEEAKQRETSPEAAPEETDAPPEAAPEGTEAPPEETAKAAETITEKSNQVDK